MYAFGVQASLHPSRVVDPLFGVGDVPVSYEANAAQILSRALPRIRRALAMWPDRVHQRLPPCEESGRYIYSATVPAGTTLAQVRVSWRVCNISRSDEGITEESLAFVLLVTRDQGTWNLQYSRAHEEDVVIADGLGSILQAAASLVLPTDIRGLALATGLSSGPFSAPNDSASALTALAAAPLLIEVTSLLVAMVSLMRAAYLRQFLAEAQPTLQFEWAIHLCLHLAQ